jgi:hypothetical protein
MAGHEHSLHTTATSERVWRVWSDTSTWKDWNPNVSRMEMDGPFVVGTTGRMHTRAGKVHSIRLTEVDPGRGFALRTKVIPLTNFTFRCAIRPGSSDGTVISQSITMGGPLGPIMSGMAGKRIAQDFEPLLRGLARTAEAGAS